MIRVDFHCHTHYSPDSLNPLEGLIRMARERGLQKLAVTDHNTIQGAVAAARLAPELIIVGEEIKTTKGEILAFFVREEVPRNLEPMETIQRLRDQGAFISVSHPFDVQRYGWQLPDLLDILPLVDAIEGFNSRCMEKKLNDMALEFARQHDLAVTVGSDAHSLREVGRAILDLPEFTDSESLRSVIRQGVATTALSSPFVHLTSWYARVHKAFHEKEKKR